MPEESEVILGSIDGIPFGEDIFAPKSNKYGSEINISHPAVLPYYHRFKVWKKAGNWPISDTHRKEFEAYMFGIIRNAMEKEKPLTPQSKSE